MPTSELVLLRDFSRTTILEFFPQCTSVEYLFEYLGELGAKSIVIEDRYVDRHFLDDYADYYSRTFNVPSAHCKRLHFFMLDAATLLEHLQTAHASAKGLREGGEALTAHYLGYVVRRPLDDASVGRTILRTYEPDSGRRNYTVVRDYDVHVMGLHLRVQGLAYQQQDGGAAVCASTALWSALQKVAKDEGERTPTPTNVTRAAGSPFPTSHGLGDDEMARAIAALGYSADRFATIDNHPLFRAQVASFLRSQLPVVLLLPGPPGPCDRGAPE